MSELSGPTAPAAAKPVPPLGQSAASGVAWLSLVSLAAKGVSFVGQIVIGWLLGKGEFGAIGLAFSTASLAGIIQQAGLRDILTQRQRRWRNWATPGLWMSLSLGVAGALIMIAAAPLASAVFHAPALTGLLILLGVRGILDSVAMIPQVQLQIQMRFKAQALVNFAVSTATIGLTVLFAWRKFGVYSVILPLPIVSLAQLIVLWHIAPPPIHARLRLRRWRFLFRDNALLMATAAFNTAISNGDYFALGLFRVKEIVGVYYFAFNLSTQSMQVLAGGLSGVLFAAMSKLQSDPHRQVTATLRAGKILSMLAIPLCALQCALSAPLFHLLWKERWMEAVLPFRLLSAAAAWAIIISPFGGLLKAQGRFLHFFYLSAGLSISFVAMVMTAAALGGAVTVAGAVLVHTTLSALIIIRVVLGPRPGLAMDLVHLIVVPWLATLLALVPTLAVAYMISRSRPHDLAELIGASAVFCATYVPLARWMMPEAFKQLAARIGGLAMPGRIKRYATGEQ